MNRYRCDVIVGTGSGGERGIVRAIGIKPGDTISTATLVCSKISTDDDLSIALQGDRCNDAGRSAQRAHRTGVEGTIGVQAHDVSSQFIIIDGKISTDKNFAICLLNDDVHWSQQTRHRVEGGVDVTVG